MYIHVVHVYMFIYIHVITKSQDVHVHTCTCTVMYDDVIYDTKQMVKKIDRRVFIFIS